MTCGNVMSPMITEKPERLEREIAMTILTSVAKNAFYRECSFKRTTHRPEGIALRGLSERLCTVIFVSLLFVMMMTETHATSSTVGTSTTSSVFTYFFQRHGFYASGLFWIFYSDGTNLVYRTSKDGESWSRTTIIRSSNLGYLDPIWFDGKYVHRVHTCDTTAFIVTYQRGTPNSDASITWSPVQNVLPAGVTYYPAFITVDTGGYPWIIYRRTDGSRTYPFVIKSSTNDGTWVNATGFPQQLSTTSADWSVEIMPLRFRRVLAIYSLGGIAIRARVWNGSAWGRETTTTSSPQSGEYQSAVAQGDTVHLVFLERKSHDIIYTKYTYSDNSWNAESTVAHSASPASSPQLSMNLVNGGLLLSVFWLEEVPMWNKSYAFMWKNTDALHPRPVESVLPQICYESSTRGIWNGTRCKTTDMSGGLGLSVFYVGYGDRIAVFYVVSRGNAYDVKCMLLALVEDEIHK